MPVWFRQIWQPGNWLMDGEELRREQVMITELWKPIPGLDGYEVSNLGRVKSFRLRQPRILRTLQDKDGYSRITLNGIPRLIHRLVLLAFIGPCPDNLEGCHNDNDKSNNRLENLRYDTHFANIQDSWSAAKRAITIRKDPISLVQRRKRARAMKEEYAQGVFTYKEIGEKYGVHLSHVARIVKGQRQPNSGGPTKGIDY